jgi:hypothetical protein
MARFTVATWGSKNRFRVVDKKNLLAFFDFVDNETGLEYQDWQLIQGKNGRFVAAPGKDPYKDKKTGKDVYPKFVAPAYDATTDSKRNVAGERFFSEVLDMAAQMYDTMSAANGSSPAPAKRSGAGPLPPSHIPADLSNRDGLPF